MPKYSISFDFLLFKTCTTRKMRNSWKVLSVALQRHVILHQLYCIPPPMCANSSCSPPPSPFYFQTPSHSSLFPLPPLKNRSHFCHFYLDWLYPPCFLSPSLFLCEEVLPFRAFIFSFPLLENKKVPSSADVVE